MLHENSPQSSLNSVKTANHYFCAANPPSLRQCVMVIIWDETCEARRKSYLGKDIRIQRNR